MRVFSKAIVLTTKCHFHVKRTYASIRGLVVRTMTSGKTRISAIVLYCIREAEAESKSGRTIANTLNVPCLQGSNFNDLKIE